MWVKICANTNLADALLAVEAGADAVGFVFAESKRRVTVAQVAAITPGLPEGVEKVGVFTTRNAAEILTVAQIAGLTAVQVHSEFDPSLVGALKGNGLRVLQVLDVPVGGGAESERELERTLRAVLRETAVDAVLLDASVKGVSGGTGVAFDWKRMSGVVRRVYGDAGAGVPKLIVAGGLRPENVVAAIEAFAPWGVDVASGVEASPGVKNAVKVRTFVGNARAAGR
jgi:phosphoribosylanthranilate isomerase